MAQPPPYDAYGTDPNTGSARKMDLTQLADGQRVLRATIYRVSDGGANPVQRTATFQATHVQVNPALNPVLVFSTNADRSNPVAADGQTVTQPWYVYLLFNGQQDNADVVSVDWYLNGLKIRSDSQAPFDMMGSDAGSGNALPWTTNVTDDGAWTLSATVHLASLPSNPVPVQAHVTVKHSASAYPRASYDPLSSTNVFNIVASPVNLYLGAPGQALQKNNSGRTADYKVILPSSAPADGLGGIKINGARSVEWVGGQLNCTQNYAQVYCDQQAQAGRWPVGSVAKGEGSVITPSGSTISAGDWQLKFETAMRLVEINNIEVAYLEGIAHDGQWGHEGYNWGGIQTGGTWTDGTGTRGRLYMQGIDFRGPMKFKAGLAGTSGGTNHYGGDVFQIWGCGETYMDDVRCSENWFQGLFIRPSDNNYNNSQLRFEANHIWFGKIRGYSCIRLMRSGRAFTVPAFPVLLRECYGLPDFRELNSAWPNYAPDSANPPHPINVYMSASGDEYQASLAHDNVRNMDYGYFPNHASYDAASRWYQGTPDFSQWPLGKPNAANNWSKAGLGYK